MKFSPSWATTGRVGRDIVSVFRPRVAWDLDLGGGEVGLLTSLGLADWSFFLRPQRLCTWCCKILSSEKQSNSWNCKSREHRAKDQCLEGEVGREFERGPPCWSRAILRYSWAVVGTGWLMEGREIQRALFILQASQIQPASSREGEWEDTGSFRAEMLSRGRGKSLRTESQAQ